jgi:flagellar biosynthesis/type III secretory pathway protein FliH
MPRKHDYEKAIRDSLRDLMVAMSDFERDYDEAIAKIKDAAAEEAYECGYDEGVEYGKAEAELENRAKVAKDDSDA